MRGVPQHTVHLQLNIPHATLERYARRLRTHLEKYIEAEQVNTHIGETELEEWEVDECTISHFPSHRRDRPKAWSAYIGLIRRGCPRYTKNRAPGPWPITKHEWLEIAEYTVKDPTHDLVMHTDSARAYQCKLAKVHHTKVVHQKKKVGRVWVRPNFVKRVKLSIAKRRLTFFAGTQTIDGVWQKMRDHAKHRVGGKMHQVNGFVRLAQFRYWTSGKTMPKKL
eukprot:5147362-Amphidinium_carterae.1